MSKDRRKVANRAPTSIPTELVGQARLLRNSRPLMLDVAMSAIQAALKPLREIVRAKAPTPWALREAARRWQEATDDGGRLSFSGIQQIGSEWLITECRAATSFTRLDGWRDQQEEPGFLVMWFHANISRREVVLGWEPMMGVSVHALARRVQRGGGTLVDGLRDTITPETFLAVCRQGRRGHIVLPTVTGHWRGILANYIDTRVSASQPHTIVSIRTWLDDDAMDNEFCGDLNRLRQATWPSDEANTLMARLLQRSGRLHASSLSAGPRPP